MIDISAIIDFLTFLLGLCVGVVLGLRKNISRIRKIEQDIEILISDIAALIEQLKTQK